MKKYLVVLLLSLFVTTAYAQNTVIVPYAPGGPTDVVARKLMEYVPDMRIEYVVGGASNLGMIKHIQKDRSLLLIAEALENNKTFTPDAYPWNILEVSRRVMLLDGAYYAIFINGDIPFGSRDPIVIGIASPGSGGHMATTGLCNVLKTCLTVPYPSAGRMVPDLIRGELHAMVALYTAAPSIVGPNINTRIHAILGPTRDGIPSFAGYTYKGWYVLLSKGYSESEIAALRAVLSKVNPKELGFDAINLRD